MTSSGRKLPDIYEAGCAKLKELEQSQHAALQQSADSSLSSSNAAQKSSITQLKKRSEDFQSQLQAAVSRSVEKIQKASNAESEETSRHLQGLLDGISKLSIRLKEAVADLNNSQQSRLSALQADTLNLHEREVETASLELQKQNYDSSKTLKVQNTFVINSFQQKLDHGVVEIRGEDRQLHNKLFKALLQNTNSIDAHVSSLMQKLSQEFQMHSDILSAKLEESQTKLNSRIEDLLVSADETARNARTDIEQAFEKSTLDSDTSCESSISTSDQRLKSLTESSSSNAISMAKQRSEELSAAGALAQQSLRDKSDEVRRHIDETTSSYTDDCNKHLEAGLRVQHELEARKGKIAERIKQEFAGIEIKYEQKLNAIVSNSTEKLTSTCNEVLEAIFTAQQNHDKQLQSISGATRDQINSALTKFIDRVKDRQESALQELRLAAAGSVPDASTKDVDEPGKKTKKTKQKNHPEGKETDKGNHK